MEIQYCIIVNVRWHYNDVNGEPESHLHDYIPVLIGTTSKEDAIPIAKDEAEKHFYKRHPAAVIESIHPFEVDVKEEDLNLFEEYSRREGIIKRSRVAIKFPDKIQHAKCYKCGTKCLIENDTINLQCECYYQPNPPFEVTIEFGNA